MCVCLSQLVDDPQQAVPAGGALVLQLVVVEEQQGAQHLPAADDGGHVLEGGGRPGEAGHCGPAEPEQTLADEFTLPSCFFYLVLAFGDRPSIAGMSAWGLARLVKGAFRSTTAKSGGMSDCRADR